MRDYHKNKQGGGSLDNRTQLLSVTPKVRSAPRGSTSCTGGGANYFYAITRRVEQGNYPYVLMGMIKVFTLNAYAFLDPGSYQVFVL